MNTSPQVRPVQFSARILILVGLAVALAVEPGASQSDYGNRLGIRESGRAIYYSTAPSLRPDAFVPSLKKWYMPQEVANHYRWQWEAGTNYARERYLRYLASEQEGVNHYDLYGRLLTRGWLIYDWQQSQPRTSEGNLLHKTDRYKDLFSSLVVSADAKGQHYFRVSIGDEIGTTLTPMTFRKTAFNGVPIRLYGGSRRGHSPPIENQCPRCSCQRAVSSTSSPISSVCGPSGTWPTLSASAAPSSTRTTDGARPCPLTGVH